MQDNDSEKVKCDQKSSLNLASISLQPTLYGSTFKNSNRQLITERYKTLCYNEQSTNKILLNRNHLHRQSQQASQKSLDFQKLPKQNSFQVFRDEMEKRSMIIRNQKADPIKCKKMLQAKPVEVQQQNLQYTNLKQRASQFEIQKHEKRRILQMKANLRHHSQDRASHSKNQVKMHDIQSIKLKESRSTFIQTETEQSLSQNNNQTIVIAEKIKESIDELEELDLNLNLLTLEGNKKRRKSMANKHKSSITPFNFKISDLKKKKSIDNFEFAFQSQFKKQKIPVKKKKLVRFKSIVSSNIKQIEMISSKSSIDSDIKIPINIVPYGEFKKTYKQPLDQLVESDSDEEKQSEDELNQKVVELKKLPPIKIFKRDGTQKSPDYSPSKLQLNQVFQHYKIGKVYQALESIIQEP
ncbi:UNKNOWN [Stylonychia lemnae]|uniref:Uncharacterized protein n=1 Tax=Stylonychia lemnae TaxID=5949 RepID=A0A078AX21_STYLE|nr:UNKNOWN [Stylonychia lemnae]|eukprot:CDW86990.1 UNKNOWN [Stylonychia lemnae]